MIRKTYTIAHLGCANCAAKMEAKMNTLTGVHATITFATKQLRIEAEDPDGLLPQDIFSAAQPAFPDGTSQQHADVPESLGGKPGIDAVRHAAGKRQYASFFRNLPHLAAFLCPKLPQKLRRRP